MDWAKLPLEPRYLGVPAGASKTISNPVVHLAQTVQLSSVKISTISKRNETSIHLSLVPKSTIGPSKMIYEPMLRLAQTMHLSCTDINTISKRTKTKFHMTHVT
jgi:hypothetical protein